VIQKNIIEDYKTVKQCNQIQPQILPK